MSPTACIITYLLSRPTIRIELQEKKKLTKKLLIAQLCKSSPLYYLQVLLKENILHTW